MLFGDQSPAGRLPVTFASTMPLDNMPADYPGINNEAIYGEGLFVGYKVCLSGFLPMSF